MASLSIRNLRKVYPGNVEAVKDFNLEIEDKEFVVFVGPSGCGKTTTLRMIAGLEDITEGEIYIDGVKINNMHPKERNIAMVFQNYALYPHMTVYDNMAFGLKLRKVDKAEIERRVNKAAEILQIKDYLKRKPKALSGGQRQRVALGRAMVREPKVFLMDEPLSNLDAKLRVEMRSEIAKLHQRLQTTFIYVTHDQTEAMTMGTRIVIMKDGVIQQNDKPKVLYDHPANLFVAGFIGSPQMNFLPCTLHITDDTIQVQMPDGVLHDLPELAKEKIRERDLPHGKEMILGIRPENLHEADIDPLPDPHITMTTTVDVVEALGAETFLYSTLYGEPLIARVSPDSPKKLGDKVTYHTRLKRIHLFEKDTEIALL